jgi:excisionase family DNA binding protein
MTAAARQLEEIRRMTPVSSPPEARTKLEKLAAAVATPRGKSAQRAELVAPDGSRIPLPDTVFHLLVRITEILAHGDAVTIVPVGKELTTQQAADLLNVSRQYLVRLLDEGRIPYTTTGKHRRLRIEDVLTYKKVRDADRRAALDELTRLSEEAGGYPEQE